MLRFAGVVATADAQQPSVDPFEEPAVEAPADGLDVPPDSAADKPTASTEDAAVEDAGQSAPTEDRVDHVQVRHGVRTPLLRSILHVLDKLLGHADEYSEANDTEGVSQDDRQRIRRGLVEADEELSNVLGGNSLRRIQRANRRRSAIVVRPRNFWPPSAIVSGADEEMLAPPSEVLPGDPDPSASEIDGEWLEMTPEELEAIPLPEGLEVVTGLEEEPVEAPEPAPQADPAAK